MAWTLLFTSIALLPALLAGIPVAAEPPAAAAATGPAEHAPPTPRKGYLLFRSEFPDPASIKPYGRAVVSVAAKFGGRFIALADRPEALEGDPDTRRVVILEFPSLDAARAFWNSPEYAEVKKLREGLGTVEAVLFEGLPLE
jgi:uncharacterized protein (DUF1330 family)